MYTLIVGKKKERKPTPKEDSETSWILLLALCHELVGTSGFLSFPTAPPATPTFTFLKNRNRIIQGTSWCQVFPPLGTECEGRLEVEPSGTQHFRAEMKKGEGRSRLDTHTVLPVLCGLSFLPPCRFLWGPRDCCWVGVECRAAPYSQPLNMHLLSLPTCETKLHLPPSYLQTLPSLCDVFFTKSTHPS